MKPDTPSVLRRLARLCEVRSERDPVTFRHWIPRLPFVSRWVVVVLREKRLPCTVILDPSQDIDDAPRCGRPSVKRLPGDLGFPVCADHAWMFASEVEG